MTEFYEAPLLELDGAQINIVRTIGERALQISYDRYCSGFPIYEDGVLLGFDNRGGEIRKLPYNNCWHNFKVGNFAAVVLNSLGMGQSLEELGRATGYTHDIRQLTGRGNDERSSAEWMQERVMEQPLPNTAAALAAKAILGTEPLFDEDGPIYGRVIGQMASRFEYDSKQEEIFVKGVSCADFGDLLTPVGPLLRRLVVLQRQQRNLGEEGDMSEMLEFQEKHVQFITDFRYLLPEAELLATHRQQVTDYTNFVYQQVRDNRLETWSQLIRQDVAFMHNPDMPLC